MIHIGLPIIFLDLPKIKTYTIYTKRTLYHVSIIIMLITIIHHTKSTCLIIDLMYSCICAPMIKWYALYKIMFKIGMHIILIIICKQVFRIIIIVNCFIFTVLCVKILTCIMCSHLYSITPIIMISRLCIILPRPSIFVSLLLYIFLQLSSKLLSTIDVNKYASDHTFITFK